MERTAAKSSFLGFETLQKTQIFGKQRAAARSSPE